MASSTGFLSLRNAGIYHTLRFQGEPSMGVLMLQYLDEILEAPDRETAILKLLGYIMEMTPKRPPRRGDPWLIVDLEEHEVQSNSKLLRKAVDGEAADPGDLCSDQALRRIHAILDRYDFSVKLFR